MNKIKAFIDEIGSEEMNSEGAIDLIKYTIIFIPKDVKSILCIGFGGGTELRLLEEKGYEVHGIDYNKNNVEKNKDFNVRQGDMHDIDFEDNSFDLVLARDVFEHSIAPMVAFREFARVSKKHIYIVLPDETWALSDLHTIIPTLKQMIALGIKFDCMLSWFNEKYHIAGRWIFKESYYIFRKK